MVDEDYRGAVGVVLFNHSSTDFQGKPCSVLEHAVLTILSARSSSHVRCWNRTHGCSALHVPLGC